MAVATTGESPRCCVHQSEAAHGAKFNGSWPGFMFIASAGASIGFPDLTPIDSGTIDGRKEQFDFALHLRRQRFDISPPEGVRFGRLVFPVSDRCLVIVDHDPAMAAEAQVLGCKFTCVRPFHC
ncbi:hypothetical protein EMEDMD4_610017 [Sinorhizobium medicae]|uniref:Uncharacterized protein n=1 Tax=Sinorhizobium medicae TaxID=110321 RepID=A0A508X4L0_9HYPH|nr:hypothetical protein EMEDMD4_610017 [Sinorhizobium medicae]